MTFTIIASPTVLAITGSSLILSAVLIATFFPARSSFMGWPVAEPPLKSWALGMIGFCLLLVALGMWMAAKGGAQ